MTPRDGSLRPVSIGPGTRLGKYELLRQLGSGAMGVVYEAVHMTLGNHVAIKVLQQLATSSEAAARRFEQEARVVARLESRHIVRVLDADQAPDGTRYLVMELMRGRDLSAILHERHVLRSEEVVDVALQVCAGLKHAHEAGIVHRDLKPANLFVAESDEGTTVKIMDFGISKDLASVSHDLTASSVIIGTPHYMSPEQIRTSRSVDERADLWSVGVVMYRLLTGTYPFSADNHAALMVAICTESPLDVRSSAPQTPEGLAKIVMTLLEKAPGQRPDSAATLGRLLLPFAPPFREYPTFETAGPETVKNPSLVPDVKASGTTQVAATVRAPDAAGTESPVTASATTKPQGASPQHTLDREAPPSRSSDAPTVETASVKAVPAITRIAAPPRRNGMRLLGVTAAAVLVTMGSIWWRNAARPNTEDALGNRPTIGAVDAAPGTADTAGVAPVSTTTAIPTTSATVASTATPTATATASAPPVRPPVRPPNLAAGTTGPSVKGGSMSAPTSSASAPTHIR